MVEQEHIRLQRIRDWLDRHEQLIFVAQLPMIFMAWSVLIIALKGWQGWMSPIVIGVTTWECLLFVLVLLLDGTTHKK